VAPTSGDETLALTTDVFFDLPVMPDEIKQHNNISFMSLPALIGVLKQHVSMLPQNAISPVASILLSSTSSNVICIGTSRVLDLGPTFQHASNGFHSFGLYCHAADPIHHDDTMHNSIFAVIPPGDDSHSLGIAQAYPMAEFSNFFLLFFFVHQHLEPMQDLHFSPSPCLSHTSVSPAPGHGFNFSPIQSLSNSPMAQLSPADSPAPTPPPIPAPLDHHGLVTADMDIPNIIAILGINPTTCEMATVTANNSSKKTCQLIRQCEAMELVMATFGFMSYNDRSTSFPCGLHIPAASVLIHFNWSQATYRKKAWDMGWARWVSQSHSWNPALVPQAGECLALLSLCPMHAC